MVRKLPLALAISLALSPAGVSALGLGDIHPRSVLNQGFKADIELLALKPGELEDVKVTLASPEAFERAGVERPYLLSKLRFKPERKSDGSAVIRVTSRQPIREPFLNFLVEVNWPKGRLVREYTVLLDPPVTLQRAPAPIMAPRTSAPAQTASAPPRPVTETQPTTPYATETYSTRVSPTVGSQEYGPTRKNDTLWNIASTLRSGEATVEQMVMALWRANPHAFFDNNVNNLRVGQVLRIPTDEEIRTLSRAEARRQFRGHLASWQEKRGLVAGQMAASGASGPGIGVAAPESELKLAAAPSQGDTEKRQSEPGSGETPESLTGLKNELLLARETGESARQEAEELRSRIGELEAQLVDVQRLLKLTNDQLARMQAAVSAEGESLTAEELAEIMSEGILEEPEAGVAAEGMATAPDGGGETLPLEEGTDIAQEGIDIAQTELMAVEGQDIAPTEPLVAEGELAQSDIMPEVAETGQETIAEMQMETQTVAETPVAPAPELTAVAPTAPAPPPEVELPEVERTSPPESGGLLDDLMSNATYLGLGAAGLVLLLGLVWLVLRRRRAEQAQFQESILTAEEEVPDAGSQTQELFDATTVASQRSDEVSFLSDFTPSSIEAEHEETGEVDPVSEADVYMTYGRYEQAEELVREALQRYPDRQDLKHKLLQIAYHTKDVVTFSAAAEDLYKVGFEQANPEAWQEIAAMGRELAPQNQLFAGVAASAAPEVLNWSEQEGKIADAEGSDIVRAAAEMPTQPETSDDLGGLDFDLGLDNADSPEAAEAALKELEASASDDVGLDLDLGELGDLEAGLGTPEPSTEQAGGEAGLTLEDLERSVRQDASEGEGLSLGDVEGGVSLDGLDLEASDLETPDLGQEFSLDTTEPLGGDDQLADLAGLGEAVGDESVLGSVSDEVTTKLDLARAYVDMGDAEGARSILGEVLTEGDESQKQQANKLLEQLS